MEKFKTERTIRAYNLNAENFNDRFEDFPAYKEKITAFHKRYVARGAQILDLGCGSGTNIKTLLELDSSCCLTGIDLSGELLGIAEKKYPSCRFFKKDMRYFKADSLFDVVLASFCIVHLDKVETAGLLRQISKSLQKGGGLYISFMEGEGYRFESTSFSREEVFFHFYSAGEITAMLEEVGIAPREIFREQYPEQDGSITTDVFIYAVKI